MSWFGDPWPFKFKVIVSLKADPDAYRGILWEERRGWLVLKQAELLKSRQGSAPIPIDGDVLIDRRDVLFIQVPPGVREP